MHLNTYNIKKSYDAPFIELFDGSCMSINGDKHLKYNIIKKYSIPILRYTEVTLVFNGIVTKNTLIKGCDWDKCFGKLKMCFESEQEAYDYLLEMCKKYLPKFKYHTNVYVDRYNAFNTVFNVDPWNG